MRFNRDIRPILSEHCFSCHGPDAGSRKADLRLDERDAAVAARAIVPGQADQSLMMDRILSADPEMIMPPPESHKVLTAAQKEKLRQWIKTGAVYEKHWSVEVPQKADVPAGVHPIDYLVLE
ncbi:MAG: c-type cytochrome domain-containing protein, partial [Planctomycetota bacterium]